MLYTCKWGPCPGTFPSRTAYVDHLNAQHLDDAALDRDVGYVQGRFRDWLRVTGRDTGTQSTTDDLLLRRVTDNFKAQTQGISRDNIRIRALYTSLPSEAAAQSSDSEDDHNTGRFSFKSLSRRRNAPASSPTPPISSVDPSPSPSALVSRGQSHIPDLPSTPSPQLSLRTQKSPANPRILRDGSPDRKRRRLDNAAANKATERSSSLATPRSAYGSSVLIHASENKGEPSHGSRPLQKSDSESSEEIELELTQDNPVEDGEEGSPDRGIVGLAELDIERLEHNIRDVLPSQQQSEDQDPDALSSLAAVHRQMSQQQVPSRPDTDNTAEDGLPILNVNTHSGSWSQPGTVSKVKTSFIPRLKSSILDMSDVTAGRPPTGSPEHTQSEIQPESQQQSVDADAEPSGSQAVASEPSQLQLLTQAPYHFPSQDSQDSQKQQPSPP